MSRIGRAILCFAAGLYLAAALLPCPPGALAQTPAGAAGEVSMSVFCPCHTGDAAAGGALGTDWQGPRSAIAVALPVIAAPYGATARVFAESRSDAPLPPVPIA